MKTILDRADLLLEEIAGIDSLRELLAANYQKDMDLLKERYTKAVNQLLDQVKVREKELRTLMKKNKKVLFEEKERLDLKHGALIYQIVKRVKRVKRMLETLEEQGFDEAIKTVKSVDWDEIEKWNDAKLELVGTMRVEKEKFEYELPENQ